ncbi:MAG: hypothetical protein A2447_00025 [Omnitrophica WOR_2 bacterium RIFOXYC2_FULL_38_12]|nr:MAG: hypothetical protein A2447_00025 [Omnitrophica WOR_2 bacterium RIFOXYC2_FULL_38_12]
MAESTINKLFKKTKESSLLERANSIFVGGVNSPVRSMRSIGMKPLIIQKGKGSRVWNVEDKSYIDHVLSFGAMILGHDHLSVEHAIKEASERGWHFGMTTPAEIELAETIKRAIPFIEKIRFVNSGTEAVMGAVRLARGFTGRKKIVKFKHSYHGHADYLLVEGGSGLATLKIPLSKGVPEEFYEQTIIAEYGDQENIETIFKKNGEDIAAIIVEPVGGNYGVVPPNEKYLNYLRQITKQNQSLLIFDEVITGFRFGFGAVADLFGIKPDLICLGKIIGGGLPIGAFGGSDGIMQDLAPLGDVYQASTFAGNPIVMAAGKATLQELELIKGNYGSLTRYVHEITESLEEVCIKVGIGVNISRYRSMFSIKFEDQDMFPKFYKYLLEQGVLLAPSEYEANFISFAHSKEDIEETKKAFLKAIKML